MTGCQPDASVAYFSAVAASSPPCPPELTSEFVMGIEALREQVRDEEGGGGMCHVMSELMQSRHGWPRLSVSYLSEDGEVICAAHVVNVFPDGSVLDTTSDQFGEGRSVTLLRAGDPSIGRYRPEFYDDFFPGHADDIHGSLDAWLPSFRGRMDDEEQRRLGSERGRGWWLADLAALDAYDARHGFGDHARVAAPPRP
jgi:hypothetical protein